MPPRDEHAVSARSGTVPVLFDPLAELFERFGDVTDDNYRPWLSQALAASGDRAVDLGCGSGRFTGLLADRYWEVLAVDVSERQIQLAERRRSAPNVRYDLRGLRDLTPERDGRLILSSVSTWCIMSGSTGERWHRSAGSLRRRGAS
jgi:trans-aconitate methyltransferase